jgi:hypothetical protein
MSEARRQLLSIGVFFIALVVAVLLFAAGAIDWTLIFPVVLVLFGIWLAVLAAMRVSSSQKYERGAFSTLSMGLLLVAVGGAWYLLVFNWLYSLVLVLIVLAVLAIATTMRQK